MGAMAGMYGSVRSSFEAAPACFRVLTTTGLNIYALSVLKDGVHAFSTSVFHPSRYKSATAADALGVNVRIVLGYASLEQGANDAA